MKFYSIKTTVAALACVGFALLTAQADESKVTLNSAEEKFIKTASQHGMGEVQVATLGIKKASRADVKAIAEKMVTDHVAMNAELTDLAKSKSVALSAITDPSDTEMLKSLEKKGTGEEFDKAFLNQLETGHKDAISLFENAAENSTDSELTAWAGKTLPALRSHLEIIQAALKK